MARSSKARALRFVLAAVVLAAVIVSLGGAHLIDRLGNARLGPIIVALLIVQIQVALSAERWRLTATRLGQTLPRPRAIAEYYVATLLNQILPGGMSGDVVRAVRNRGDDDTTADRWQRPTQAIVLERTAGQLALLVMAALGWAVWPLAGHGPIPGGARTLVATSAVLAIVVAIVGMVARFAPARVAGFAAGFGPALGQAWLARDSRWPQIALSLLIVASYLAVFALCSMAVDAPLSFVATLALVPLALLTMLLPVSVAGWGVREAAAAALWPLAGASVAEGVAASLLYGLVCLMGAAPGAIVLARRRTPRAHAAQRRA